MVVSLDDEEDPHLVVWDARVMIWAVPASVVEMMMMMMRRRRRTKRVGTDDEVRGYNLVP
jgi:hypothetical protein